MPPLAMSTLARKQALIRKQIGVTAEQARALERKSRELGVSEAEVIRRALDDALLDASSPPSSSPLGALLLHTQEHGRGRTLEKGWSRDSLYAGRGAPLNP